MTDKQFTQGLTLAQAQHTREGSDKTSQNSEDIIFQFDFDEGDIIFGDEVKYNLDNSTCRWNVDKSVLEAEYEQVLSQGTRKGEVTCTFYIPEERQEVRVEDARTGERYTLPTDISDIRALGKAVYDIHKEENWEERLEPVDS